MRSPGSNSSPRRRRLALGSAIAAALVLGAADSASSAPASPFAPFVNDGQWIGLPSAPVTRGNHSAIYDPVAPRMVVFGGFSEVSGDFSSAAYQLTLGGAPTWTLLAPSGTPPAGRGRHTAIYDPARRSMIVF